MKKRVISVLLVVLMVVMLIPQNLQAVSNTEDLISYVAVEKASLPLGDEQHIVVGIGTEDTDIEMAELIVLNTTTGIHSAVDACDSSGGAVCFRIDYSAQNQSGEYMVKGLTYQTDGIIYNVDLPSIGIDAHYGVACEVETNPDAVAVDSDVDIQIVGLDEDETTIETETIADAIEYATADNTMSKKTRGMTRSADSNVVVVLDPGHDNTHVGASANGLHEEQLTLKIAQFCKQELEKYQGVTVYMTRGDDGSCPYPGTTSGKCNENRVAFAQSVGASVYVSIHLNSASSSNANGVEIYYPNQNYNLWASAVGESVASHILTQLTALGLNDRGLKIRDSTDGSTYPDGSPTDYYGVIRNSKMAGIGAIIVEHAFLSGNVDASTYLSSEDRLRSLGIADATGIANAFGLEKRPEWSASGLYLLNHSHDNFTVGMVTDNPNNVSLEYRWLIYDINAEMWKCVQNWNGSEWLSWNPEKSGSYLIRGEVREIGNENKCYDFTIGSEHQQYIKGKCQMPYTGPGGGYLIGVESFDNPNQLYQYEMLILDCTLLSQGQPAWVYTTGKNRVSSGNAMWTIWQPQYGYYWTLFRVYDTNGNLLDEQCYGFQNI